MKHPKEIMHVGVMYNLEHLVDGQGRASWKTQEGKQVTYEISTVYADHCYSDEKLPRTPGCHIVRSQGRVRDFCPDRYARSLSLPRLFEEAFFKASVPVHMTEEKNWTMFYLAMKPDVPKGKRYYVFSHVKFLGKDPEEADVIPVEIFVESAYLKDNKVFLPRRAPLGRVIEEAVLKRR